MKKLIVKIMVLTSFFGFIGCKSSTDPSNWSSRKIDKWFEKGEWLNGWTVSPDASVNRKELAVSYFKNKERWDKAFTFLKTSDLFQLELKRYEIDGDNLYAPVSEYLTKNEADAKFEAHQKYIDIQYVISGIEQISVSPLSMKKDVLVPYDSTKDVGFMTVTKCKSINATPDKFFIFFPSDIHRPGVKAGENSQVRKVVVKVRVD
ncbi:MAG: YhcH/YjgK/YiaL family protein [Bacteroidia bacterium]|nr:YhcH/YjgK/YiaL family protein [Bacteroidia bacterium]